MDKLGLYIHIPFCVKKCAYCDFCSYPATGEDLREEYVNALIRDIKERGRVCAEYCADTVYFGGGTPTLLTLSQFERIFKALHESFDICEDAEITAECNPATADREYFEGLRALGVNRLSIGMQSAHDRELKALGRVHRAEDFLKAFSDAREAGFENISADLMFGIPEQTEESFKKTLETLASLEPEHISAYGLILEPGTPFFANREKLVLPDEDSEYNMYTEAYGFLERHGYKRYEISNFARSGKESRHNLKYWNSLPYLGLGPAASSCLAGRRFTYPRDTAYFLSGGVPVDDPAEGPAVGSPEEYALLRLRLTDGLTEAGFCQRYGTDLPLRWRDNAARLPRHLVVADEKGIRLTREGFLLSNSLICYILGE